MPLWVVPVLAGLACAVSAWRAHRSGSHAARFLALGTGFIWAFANLGWLCNALWLLPVGDVLVGVGAFALARQDGPRWVAAYADLMGVRLILHVLNSATGQAFQISYFHALNATFAGLIVAVGISGGGNGARTGRFDRLLDSLGRRTRIGVARKAPGSEG